MTPGQKDKFKADMVEKARKANAKIKALKRDRKAAGAARVNVGAQPKRPNVTTKVSF